MTHPPHYLSTVDIGVSEEDLNLDVIGRELDGVEAGAATHGVGVLEIRVDGPGASGQQGQELLRDVVAGDNGGAAEARGGHGVDDELGGAVGGGTGADEAESGTLGRG